MENYSTLFNFGLLSLSLLTVLIVMAKWQVRNINQTLSQFSFAGMGSGLAQQRTLLVWTTRLLMGVWLFWFAGWIQALYYYQGY